MRKLFQSLPKIIFMLLSHSEVISPPATFMKHFIKGTAKDHMLRWQTAQLINGQAALSATDALPALSRRVNSLDLRFRPKGLDFTAHPLDIIKSLKDGALFYTSVALHGGVGSGEGERTGRRRRES